MSFNIIIRDDISLNNLLKIINSGGRVLKTPHIGNIYPNNLAIITLNIPTLLYDRNIGFKDKSFHPHKIIFDSRNEEISDPGILSTHSKIILQPSIFKVSENVIGTSIVDFHMSILEKSIPNSNIFTYSYYIKQNKKLITKIVKEVVKEFPELWHNLVDINGVVHKKNNPSIKEILDIGIFGIDKEKEGWIIPNPVNILFHGTVDAIMFNTKDIYLLSGPDMYLYIKEYEEILNSLYGHIRKIPDLGLPDSVNCYIIPTINMRFIIKYEKKYILDQLVDLYKNYKYVYDKIKNYFKNPDQDIDINYLIKEKNKIKLQIINLFKTYYSDFERVMFYDINKENCFTQYDLFNSSGIYIHPWALESKLNDLSFAFNFLNRCFKSIKIEKSYEDQ